MLNLSQWFSTPTIQSTINAFWTYHSRNDWRCTGHHGSKYKLRRQSTSWVTESLNSSSSRFREWDHASSHSMFLVPSGPNKRRCSISTAQQHLESQASSLVKQSLNILNFSAPTAIYHMYCYCGTWTDCHALHFFKHLQTSSKTSSNIFKHFKLYLNSLNPFSKAKHL